MKPRARSPRGTGGFAGRLRVAGLVGSGLLGLAACASTPPARPAREAAPVVAPSASSVPIEPACDDAAMLLDEVDARLDAKNDRRGGLYGKVCAADLALSARTLCPSIAKRAESLAKKADENERASRELSVVEISDDGEVALTHDGNGFARIFALGPEPRLVFRVHVEGMFWIGPSHRVYALDLDTRTLLVLDAKTGRADRFDDTNDAREVDGSLLLSGDESIRRLDLASLRELGRVPISKRLDNGSVRLLANGRTALIGDSLVSFERGTVLARGLDFVGVSRDESRLLACDTDASRIVVLDRASGAELSALPLRDSWVCHVARPTLSPDGRRVIAFERKDDGFGGSVVIAVTDIATKTTRRFPDPRSVYSTALGATASFRASDDARICLDFGNMHWHEHQCRWVLEKNGAIAIRPEPEGPPRITGLRGLELARATSPDGARIAVLTYEDHTPKTKRKDDDTQVLDHLRLFVADTKSKRATSSIDILPERFFAAPEMMHGDHYPDVLRFVSPSRALLVGGPNASIPTFLLDLDALTATKTDPDVEWISSHFARENDKLVDLASDRSWSLIPADDAWSNATVVRGPCSSWDTSAR